MSLLSRGLGPGFLTKAPRPLPGRPCPAPPKGDPDRGRAGAPGRAGKPGEAGRFRVGPGGGEGALTQTWGGGGPSPASDPAPRLPQAPPPSVSVPYLPRPGGRAGARRPLRAASSGDGGGGGCSGAPCPSVRPRLSPGPRARGRRVGPPPRLAASPGGHGPFPSLLVPSPPPPPPHLTPPARSPRAVRAPLPPPPTPARLSRAGGAARAQSARACRDRRMDGWSRRERERARARPSPPPSARARGQARARSNLLLFLLPPLLNTPPPPSLPLPSFAFARPAMARACYKGPSACICPAAAARQHLLQGAETARGGGAPRRRPKYRRMGTGAGLGAGPSGVTSANRRLASAGPAQ